MPVGQSIRERGSRLAPNDIDAISIDISISISINADTGSNVTPPPSPFPVVLVAVLYEHLRTRPQYRCLSFGLYADRSCVHRISRRP